MDEMRYLDFELLIERWEKGYRARVTGSPAGWGSVEFTLPFSDLEVENFVLRMAGAGRNVRRINKSQMGLTKMFGGRLFEAIFSGETYNCLVRSLDEAERQEAGLRIQLRLDAPELADLPWEYLYNSADNRFLTLSKETPLVRFLDLPGQIPPQQVAHPLKVLVMIAQPLDARPLNVGQEWDNLNEALADLMREGLITLERLEYATLAALQRKLRQDTYHIFHFIGHGAFDKRSQDGLLLLEDEKGMGQLVSGQRLGTLLRDKRSLRLVVLNACEGARTSRTDPFAGVAQSLLQQGTPAVIAMQFEVSDKSALTFAHEFYAALADNYPVDAALGEARKAIYREGYGAEWGAPVLYLRTPNGRIFDIAPSPHQEPQIKLINKTEASPQPAIEPPPSHQPHHKSQSPLLPEEVAPDERNWRPVLIMVAVGSVMLLILAVAVIRMRDTPSWAAVTPTPALPAEAIILSADLDNCDQTTNLAKDLSAALPDTVTVEAISPSPGEENIREEAKQERVLAAVWGECIDAQTNVSVTILFAGDSPYPVSLLQEPKQLTLRAQETKGKIFAQASVLYAVGQYEEANKKLQNLAEAYQDAADKANLTDFYWLRGNILLRREDWLEAHNAYKRGLRGLRDDSPLKPKLLANRGVTALFAKQSDSKSVLCQINGTDDLEEALSLNKERSEADMFQAELHVLLGTIMLKCPRSDGDIEENAWEQAERALKRNPDSALAYALKAKVGAENRAKNIGDPLTVQSHACKAIEQDDKLPDPHRTLGRIYARHGLADKAREQYKMYGQLATLKWQRKDAAQQWSKAHKATHEARDGLGDCN